MIHYVLEESLFARAVDFLKNNYVLGVDTETTGLDPYNTRLLLLQIGTTQEQYVFNVPRLNIAGIDWTPIKHILGSTTYTKILHSAGFDYKMLKHHLKIDMVNMRDTMIAAHVIRNGLQKAGFGLADLLANYGIAFLDKSIRSSFIDKEDDYISVEEVGYSAQDIAYIILLHNRLERELRGQSLLDVYNLECECIPATAEMEYNGIQLDRVKWIKLEANFRAAKTEAREKLDKFFEPVVTPNLFGKPTINYNSSAQLLKYLTVILGRALPNTQKQTLKSVEHPATNALLNYKEAEKRLTTYGSGFYRKHVNPVTGRIHARFQQTGGTESGRYAVKNPKFIGAL